MLKLWKIINYTEVFFLLQNNNINKIKKNKIRDFFLLKIRVPEKTAAQ